MKYMHYFWVIFVIITVAWLGVGCTNSPPSVPVDEQVTLMTEEPAPVAEQATSTDESATPTVEQVTLMTEEPAPVAEQATSTDELATPTVEQVTPMAEANDIETFWKDFEIASFGEAHAPVDGNDNEHLIYGNIPISPPAKNMLPEFAALLGRWEGYDYGGHVAKDIKIVFVVQEISNRGGKGVLWGGNNLQYPFDVKEIQFKVVPGDPPSIEWTAQWPDRPNINATFTFLYNPDTDHLEGELNYAFAGNPASQSIELTRDQTFYVYKDHEKYLAGKGIYPKMFDNDAVQRFGPGYLLYLPEGYEDSPEKEWPLIFFLCGSGDRGDNIFLVAKTGPFQMIREQGPLPFIVVAPGLNMTRDYRSFPEEYMDGMLEEALQKYRVDKSRIYVTGLSSGGEASYRFALHRPEMVAAISPVAAADARHNSMAAIEGFPYFEPPLERAKDIPVWAFHGARDAVVPLTAAQQTVDDFIKAGADVRFTVYEENDHDAWTNAYTDPQLYTWFLQHKKPL